MTDTIYSGFAGGLEARDGAGAENPALSPREVSPGSRPRERLLARGPGALSDHELLAILLNTGIRGRNVTLLAKDLLERLDRDNDIPPVKELVRLTGLGETKACAVAAMLEYGRRRWGASGVRIKDPQDIFTLIRHYADRKQERFICISLNGVHEALAVRVVTVGLVNRTIIHPREVFSDVIQDRAAAVIAAHNHPSGNLKPSPEDDGVTLMLMRAADVLGIRFLDHVIFSETAYFSYRQAHKMPVGNYQKEEGE
jgi:DNA repair protein RadC